MEKKFVESRLYISNECFVSGDYSQADEQMKALLHKLSTTRAALESISFGWSLSRDSFRIIVLSSISEVEDPQEPKSPKRRFDL